MLMRKIVALLCFICSCSFADASLHPVTFLNMLKTPITVTYAIAILPDMGIHPLTLTKTVYLKAGERNYQHPIMVDDVHRVIVISAMDLNSNRYFPFSCDATSNQSLAFLYLPDPILRCALMYPGA
jgi:hypothetical protein